MTKEEIARSLEEWITSVKQSKNINKNHVKKLCELSTIYESMIN